MWNIPLEDREDARHLDLHLTLVMYAINHAATKQILFGVSVPNSLYGALDALGITGGRDLLTGYVRLFHGPEFVPD